VTHREGEADQEGDGGGDEHELAGGLTESKPLDAVGEVYEFALANEIQALAERDHGREGDDDRGQAEDGDEEAVEGPEEGAEGEEAPAAAPEAKKE
jgi:hypothetical protein